MYSVRRVCKAMKEAMNGDLSLDQQHGWMLHILEKVPRRTPVSNVGVGDSGSDHVNISEPPPAPHFGAEEINTNNNSNCEIDHSNYNTNASTTCPTISAPENSIELSSEEEQEKQELIQRIAERKAELKDEGLSLKDQKKDLQISGWNSRLRLLHCKGEKYERKVQERCQNRVHVSVLLDEAVKETVSYGPDELYVDCTFGRGGHSKLILSGLSKKGRLKAFDVDPLAVEVGKKLEANDVRFSIIHAPFSELASKISEPIAGILLDLGVSSPQLDDPSRGCSVKGKKDGPLDLRMNQEVGKPAWEWLQTVTVSQLAWIIRSTCYRLDEPLPERIADAILQQQSTKGPFASTMELARLLDEIEEELEIEHPHLRLAHIVFCAIRVFLNREMEQLELVLEAAVEQLRDFGRCVVICFTRWERYAVRKFLRKQEEPSSEVLNALRSMPTSERLAQLYPSQRCQRAYAIKQLPRIKPSANELERNQRAKSIAYVFQKIPKS
eukprot:TRINITY_DN30754_c0_g1_i1.p1 TRINITY_DN30754_c0_g1~~TRINITY_DN30754_c0_g1_i1.p1  ORF type:complete len:565 (-),score=93.55 TRINITY_DN30754_c0_g1_i1:66-1556(-)